MQATVTGLFDSGNICNAHDRLPAMACWLCKKLCDWLCADTHINDDFWQISARWEQNHSNDGELWIGDSEDIRKENSLALELLPQDGKRALEISKALADRGSAWAMQQVGRQFELGHGVEQDFALAEQYYYRAQMAGSWTAALALAKLLFHQNINENWAAILENGVKSGFLPANFWLAHFRFKRNPQRRTARVLRPMLEEAAQAGHPGARRTLSSWQGRGRFGLKEVVRGYRANFALLRALRSGELERNAETVSLDPTLTKETVVLVS